MTSTDTGLGIEAKSDAIYELVEQGAQVERVATGFTFTEGPIWHPTEHYLLFSDMPGDVRRKYSGSHVVHRDDRLCVGRVGNHSPGLVDFLSAEHANRLHVRAR